MESIIKNNKNANRKFIGWPRQMKMANRKFIGERKEYYLREKNLTNWSVGVLIPSVHFVKMANRKCISTANKYSHHRRQAQLQITRDTHTFIETYTCW